MSYFKYLPTTSYSFDGKNFKSCTDIMTSAKLVDYFKQRSNNLYIDYIVKDGEKPEHIAARVYDKPELNWLVLFSNNIMDPYFGWPMSSEDLSNHIASQYPGFAVFVDCLATNISFQVYGSVSTFLTPEKSNFVVGNTVTQTNRTATVSRWDPTLRKVELINQTGTFDLLTPIISTNADGTQFQVTPKRIVYDNSYAVHHFIDDFGNLLDPYGKINFGQYPDGKIYSSGSYFTNPLDTSSGDTYILNLYINSNQNTNVITNRFFETRANDQKRNIKLIKVEYVNDILQQLSVLFNGSIT